ncbi:MAG: DNRLRE domain-containing protein [Planctomycetota bacterium]|nr:DNRLRE domain-containing protein [Planctomycetota bacterium]
MDIRMPSRVCRSVVGSLLFGIVSSGYAQTVSLSPIKDNTLFSTGTTSNGAGPQFFSGRTGAFRGFIKQRAVLEFDIAGALPVGATITSVSLTLHLERAGNHVDELHTLHRLFAEWGEGTSASGGGQGGPATPDDATWLHTYFPGQFWANEGGDFESTPSADQMVPPQDIIPIPVTWGSTPEMIADVQHWLDQPDENHGWLLLGNEIDANTARKFSSRENFEADQWPTLTIEYELAPPCPYDLDGDGIVFVLDLLQVVHALRTKGDVAEDLDGDGKVTPRDMHLVIRNFGPCP